MAQRPLSLMPLTYTLFSACAWPQCQLRTRSRCHSSTVSIRARLSVAHFWGENVRIGVAFRSQGIHSAVSVSPGGCVFRMSRALPPRGVPEGQLRGLLDWSRHGCKACGSLVITVCPGEDHSPSLHLQPWFLSRWYF